jgi:hypothetical protein
VKPGKFWIAATANNRPGGFGNSVTIAGMKLGWYQRTRTSFKWGRCCHRVHNGCCSLRPRHRSRAKCF